MRLRYFAPLVLACPLFLFLHFQKKHTVRQDNLVLSSAVEGQLLDNGKPVAEQKVTRTLHWNMQAEPYTEITTTNEDGLFQFPEVRGAAEFGILAKLFHVPTVSIRIFVPVKDVEHMAYANSRNSYNESVETGLPLIRLFCDLKDREIFDDRLPVINCTVEESEERKALKYD
ncbi:MAG: hypothetical protein O9274_02040 [Limnobacter sp.]|uniref:DUF6795 domain-containing protein n=1 Tax=Limnobacter sp. TaxID=2003368 RepID=UPI0022C32A33|nr:DUF6795 domain-containing protein [Limnobacter sp.]MCZ8014455.1 hypothetical protein [Limnobacter sp.]